MRISDWSSDVCSSDLWHRFQPLPSSVCGPGCTGRRKGVADFRRQLRRLRAARRSTAVRYHRIAWHMVLKSEEHTSELQSLMRSSYAVFCLKKKQTNRKQQNTTHTSKQ